MNITSTYTSPGRELSRLLTAAVVNRKFCQLLLSNPETALSSGYHGEAFRLGTDEKKLILSIQAQTLADFARQLTVGSQGRSLH